MPHADPAARRAYARSYYLAHREEFIADAKAWKLANPERHRAAEAAYKERHKDKIRGQERRRHLLSKYGDTYWRLLEEQGGVCAICGDGPTERHVLQVDHDHACCPTQKTCGECVRGLLCHLCNKALGLLRDRADFAANAARYLERS